MTDGRIRTGAITAGAITALLLTATASPSAAEPTVDQAHDTWSKLDRKADKLETAYRPVVRRLDNHRDELTKTQHKINRALRERRQTRDRAVLGLLQDAQWANALVEVREPRTTRVSRSGGRDVTRLLARNAKTGADVDRLRAQEQELMRDIMDLARQRKAMAPATQRAMHKADQARALMDRLREERASRAAARTPAPAAAPVASSGAAAAVSYAMAQVGDAYSYGAAGPSAFDCSGLTMMAWAAAGVGLPHSSGAQMGSGTPVSTSALQPGDLVFYYSPVSHVGIYIGNGMIVHAANPSTGVQVAPLNMMPLVGAVRPG